MKKNRLSAALGLLLFAAGSLAVRGQSPALPEYYIENEWNFCDASIEPSEGIPPDASGVLARIERDGVLRVATESGQPPYVFQNPGKTGQAAYEGADMELARLIARRMGVELKITEFSRHQVLPAVMEEQCDLALSAISFTPSRAIYYAMSKSYHEDAPPEIGLLIREEDAGQISSLQDLKGKVLVAQRNSLPETLAAELVTGYSEFWRTSSPRSVFEFLEEGRADAGFADMGTASYYMAQNPDCGLTLLPELALTPPKQYLGFRAVGKKGENELMYFVNGVIDEVLADGTYDEWLMESEELADRLGLS